MRRLLAILVISAAALAGVLSAAASAERPAKVRVGDLALTFNGGFRPKALPKRQMAPIGLNVSGKIRTLDGSHPPALREFVLETDRNGGIDVKGYPTCRSGQLQSRDTNAAQKACGEAIIGRGKTKVEVAFPEQKPIPVSSKLLVFNGGVAGGTTTLFIHAYFNAPITGAIVTTVKIKKIHAGRYGIRSIATIPKIAGGAGSVTDFSLGIRKVFRRHGDKVSVLSARCTDGKLQARGEARFVDGTRAKAEVVRSCRPR